MKFFRRKPKQESASEMVAKFMAGAPGSSATPYERGCPVCKHEGVKSKCAAMRNPFVWGGISFVDEDGKTHQHLSESIQRFECERGHSWTEVWDSTCHLCGTPQPDPEIIDEGVRWL